MRASEQERLSFVEEHLAIYLLAPDTKRSMMPILCVYEPGGGSVEPFRTESDEFIHVFHGKVKIDFEDGETIELAAGDSIYLIEPHRSRRYRNASRGKTVSRAFCLLRASTIVRVGGCRDGGSSPAPELASSR